MFAIFLLIDQQENAFALPICNSGDIYFYRGYLKRMKNEDQLAIIVGHELAHTILGHAAEKLSYSRIFDIFAIVGAYIIWSIFPSDWTSFSVNYIFEEFIKFAARLPYSRRMEEEADQVGLMLAAKACYDVRESVVFWKSRHETEGEKKRSEYRSTHPSHAKRAENLNKILSWALDIRSQCNCSPLPQNKTLGTPNLSKNPDEKIMEPFGKRVGGFRHIPVMETMKKE